MKYLLLVLFILSGCSTIARQYICTVDNIEETISEIKDWHKEKVIENKVRNEKELEWYTDRNYTGDSYAK